MKGNILVIGDTHIPFEHRDYLDFCKQTQKKHKCTQVVHIGDLVDNHAISFHDHDPNGRSPVDEMKLADKKLAKWFKAFPKVKLCKGNHDELAWRRAYKHALPERILRNFKDIWNLPKAWDYEYAYQINGIKFFHGTGYSGQYAHIKAAKDYRQSVVMGHLHSVAGVEWTASDRDCIFGLATGCGVDRKTYAFKYSRDFVRKPILGCGLITDGGRDARFVPMKMT
jgi:predicted phosphodiesterase